MGRISNILHTKGKIIYSVTPDTIVYSALEVMFEKNISALLVMENNYPVGIFTERDYARNVELKGKSSREIRIDSVMTKNLITVSPDNTIEEAMRLMTTKFIRNLSDYFFKPTTRSSTSNTKSVRVSALNWVLTFRTVQN